MHLRHKWSTVFKQPSHGVLCTMQLGRTVSEEKIDTINVVEKCTVCGKKRGYTKESTGRKWPLDVDYVELNYNEGKPL